MNRRQFLSLAPLATCAAAQSSRKPNLILIISDDHHWQCLGANGNPHIRTPNLDRLAARGVNFRNGTISVAQCAPSRGVLLSGREIYQTGLDSNGHTGFRSFTGKTVVEQLRQAGYATTLVGKWHIQPLPAECGFAQAPLWLRGGASKYRDPALRRGLGGKDEVVPGHITDLFTDAAVETVKAATQPYLLWLAYNAPHTPWYADGKYKYPAQAAPAHPPQGKPYDWETYYAVITHLDEAIGRLVDAVEKAGQWDNTLFVFVGDNGYLCGTKGLSGKVFPWEESVRVPFFASGGVAKKRQVSEAMVASVDIPATLLDCAGVKPAHALAGTSFRPVLEGKAFGRDAAFVSWVDGREEALAVRYAVEPYRAVRMGKWKYIVWESRKEALFDIEADAGEEKDLSATHGKERKEMRSRLAARMKATSDPAASWLI